MEDQAKAIFVDKFYEMDPQLEDLLSEGRYLQSGMIVLLEDSGMREDNQREDRYTAERLREVNRWCEVSQVVVRKRYLQDDYGATMREESSPLISFVATYSDGTKKKRTYDSSYAWIVKLDSIPKCGNPECEMAGNCELNENMVRECVVNF